MNNKPGVNDATRRRVQELADKLGYRPSRIAQSLALQKSHVLGFIAADLVNLFYIDLFRRVQRATSPQGYQVLICDSEQSVDREKENLDIMRQHRAEGLLIFPVHDWKTQTDLDHFLRLRLARYPFVVVGKLDEVACDSVTNEEVETGLHLAEHLISLGHRRIAFIGAVPSNRPVRERIAGVAAALKSIGSSLGDTNLIHHHSSWIQEMKDLLRSPERPTALIFMNDILALHAYRELLGMGLSIPRDLSIVTFGNSIWTQYLKPTITGTVENVEEVSRVAIELLLKRMNDPESPLVQATVAQEIVVRESSGPPPA